jgi:ABC-type uncharacterized transport system permease subunit
MLSGVGIICFAASYAIAWVLEISRLFVRSGVRGAVMLGFAGAGLLAHTAFLYYRAVHAIGAPLSSEKDWFLVAAWAMIVVYLFLAIMRPKIPFGLFLLPMALVLIGAGEFLAPTEPLAREPASKIWGAIHGFSILLATVSVLVGFVAGMMYLGQSRRLKHKRLPTGRLRLPSLEWLQRANSHAIVTSLLMLGIGILSGMVLNLINIRNDAARLDWNDPVVLSTWLMFFWLLAVVVVIGVYRPAGQGRKVAYLTVASFIFLAIMLAAGLLMDSRHWGRGEGGRRKAEGGKRLVIENWSLQIGHCQPQTTMANDKSPIFNDQSIAFACPPSAHRLPPFLLRLPPSALRLSPGGRPC